MTHGIDCTLAPVNIGELDREDGRFAVLSYTSSEELDKSLDRFGILQPPWVLERSGGKAIVVDGFKRLRWLCRSGACQTNCLIFKDGSDFVEVWRRRIEGRLFGPPPNAAEKARIVERLAGLGVLDAWGRGVLSRLGVPSRPEVYANWVRLAGAGDLLLEAAATEAVCERAAMELLDWEEKDRERVVSLFRDLRCSASIQVEILDRLREISLRDGLKQTDVMDDPGFQSIVDSPERNHREKTRDLRVYLDRMRFPRLTARVERFGEEHALLHLPGNIRLIPPASFEGDRWQMQVTFANPGELAEALEEVRSRAKPELLSRLMAPDHDPVTR